MCPLDQQQGTLLPFIPEILRQKKHLATEVVSLSRSKRANARAHPPTNILITCHTVELWRQSHGNESSENQCFACAESSIPHHQGPVLFYAYSCLFAVSNCFHAIRVENCRILISGQRRMWMRTNENVLRILLNVLHKIKTRWHCFTTDESPEVKIRSME